MIQKSKIIDVESKKLALSMQMNEFMEMLKRLKDFKVNGFP